MIAFIRVGVISETLILRDQDVPKLGFPFASTGTVEPLQNRAEIIALNSLLHSIEVSHFGVGVRRLENTILMALVLLFVLPFELPVSVQFSDHPFFGHSRDGTFHYLVKREFVRHGQKGVAILQGQLGMGERLLSQHRNETGPRLPQDGAFFGVMENILFGLSLLFELLHDVVQTQS